jgi:hypothetical protein
MHSTAAWDVSLFVTPVTIYTTERSFGLTRKWKKIMFEINGIEKLNGLAWELRRRSTRKGNS